MRDHKSMRLSTLLQYKSQYATFPELEAKNLNDVLYSLPKDFTGALNLVMVAFQRRHQDDVDTWVPFLERLQNKYPEFNFYELPTLPKWNFVARFLLKKGMQAGIPSEDTRERTITLHIDLDPFLEQLHISNLEQIQLFLVDNTGKILWNRQGSFTSHKYFQLEALVTMYFRVQLTATEDLEDITPE